MKKLVFLFCCLVCLQNTLIASIYIIGNDTLHFEEGNYFVISTADTFYIDSTLIFVKYDNQAEAEDKIEIESTYHLTKDFEFIFGWTSYSYDLENTAYIDLLNDLSNEALIDMVDYNTSIYFACDALETSDPYLYDQWFLDQIEARNAWNITKGDPDIIVAILDTGFDWEHPDLGEGYDGFENVYVNMGDPWTDPSDPSTGDGLDNDGNDYTDDYKGWGQMYEPYHFFLGNDVRNYDYEWLYQQFGIDAFAPWMHGTFIAGIIGAKTNNNTGISGIAGGWNDKGASLMFYKIGIGDHPIGAWVNRAAQGIQYAVNAIDDHPSDIIEMAFTAYDDPYSVLATAIQYAFDEGAFMVAAAGNFDQGGLSSVGFPANHEYVLAVGATDNIDHRKSNSCFGPELDLGAPGENILGLLPYDDDGYEYEYNDGYEIIDGNTSAASAMVSASAALMLSVNPNLSFEDMIDILHTSSDKGDYYTYYPPGPYGHNDEIGYGRLNSHRAVCMAWDLGEDVLIDEDKSWNSDLMQMNPVIVQSGNTLIITAIIQFGPEAPLIIEPGAIVIIDGGTLTNMKCCYNANKSWPGIQVWGNTNASQAADPCPMGQLIMRNEAKIENAVIAVDLWKPGDYSKTGGIIDADNAIFLNNANAVHALWYRNFNPYNPSQELDYYGSFNNCSFIIDEYYLGDKTFYKHVDLAHVKGLKFYGCSFDLSPLAENVSEWNLGIAAYSAGFSVLPVCVNSTIPCEEYDSCRFNGFYWAIGLYSSEINVYPVSIRNAHFDNNNTGVFNSLVNYAIIVDNFFEVGYDEVHYDECPHPEGYGIDMQGGFGFVIENNKFRPNAVVDTVDWLYAGIRVLNCPSVHDIIYKNEIIGLSYGNYAEGINRSVAGFPERGIEYQCNINEDNAVDFLVTDPSDPYRAMIRQYQGALDFPCGNTFSETAKYHFYLNARNRVEWYYSSSFQNQIPDESRVFTLDYIYWQAYGIEAYNECPDHYGGGGHIELTENERLQAEADYIQNLNDYNSVSALYESLIDGGNTETELTDIQYVQPDDMWDMRAQLLGHSPHLSQEVLRATADRTDVFPDDILLEILSANPDELSRDTLLNYLEQKEDPLPDYMIEILRDAANGVTYKTILEEDMAIYHAGKTRAAQDILRSILADSIFDAVDYRNWLDNLGGIEADKQIIASYLNENDTTSAIYLLNLIPSLYELTGDELDSYNDYQDMIMRQIEWMSDDQSIFDLDSIEIAELKAIAEDVENGAHSIARNILRYGYNDHFCNCLEYFDSTLMKSHPGSIVSALNEAFGPRISAEPNPAHSWIAFNYQLSSDHSSGLIRITDISGRLVKEFSVGGQEGQQIWDVRQVKPGLYNYVFIESGLVKSGKVVIQ